MQELDKIKGGSSDANDDLVQFNKQRKLQNKVLKKMVEELGNAERDKLGKNKKR